MSVAPLVSNGGRGGGSVRLLVVLVLLSNLLCGGVIFGWVAMQSLLEEDGVHRGLCPEEEPRCAARMNRFVLLFTIGTTVFMLGQFPCGFLVDRLGPVKSNMLTCVVTTAGSLILGFAEDHDLNGFAVGAFLIGLGGSLVMIGSIPLSFIVPDKYRMLTITTVNGIFQMSPVCYLVVYALYSRTGLSRQAILGGYAVISAAVHIGLAVAWGCGTPSPYQRLLDAKARESEANEQNQVVSQKVKAEVATPPTALLHDEEQPAARLPVAPCAALEIQQEIASQKQLGKPAATLGNLSLGQQLLTFEAAFLCIFYSTQVFRNNMFVATIKTMLDQYGDAETGGTYAQIFGASLFFSALFPPLITWYVKRMGFAGSFLTIVTLGVCWNVMSLISVLPLQLLTFAFFVPFRVGLFAVHFVFLSETFGSRTSGSVQGILSIFAAALNFLVYASVVAAESVPGPGFKYLYIFLLFASLPSAAGALLLRRHQAAMRPKAKVKAQASASVRRCLSSSFLS